MKYSYSNGWKLLALALLVSYPLFSQTKTLGPRDYPLQSCTASPGIGFVRQCADSATGNLLCVNSNGGNCTPNSTITAGSMSLPTAAVPATSCSATATTVTANGVLPTDVVAWSFNGDNTGVTGYGAGALIPKVWASANAVNVKLCNSSAASITPGAASINWSIPGRSGSPTTTSIQHHSVGTCTNGSTNCTLTGQIVGATGNAAFIAAAFCWNATCSGNITPACTVGFTDGTNTYTPVAPANATNSTTSNTAIGSWVAGNATAGTYSINMTVTGTGCSINFAAIWFVDIGPAAASPVDTQVVNVTIGNIGTAVLLNSVGSVAYQNELVIGVAACWNNQAINQAGSFIMLDRTASTYYANFYLASPAPGAAVQFTATCAASTAWSANMVGLHN